jgi:hypothetical protein
MANSNAVIIKRIKKAVTAAITAARGKSPMPTS